MRNTDLVFYANVINYESCIADIGSESEFCEVSLSQLTKKEATENDST
jgi:hypothetical protein